MQKSDAAPGLAAIEARLELHAQTIWGTLNGTSENSAFALRCKFGRAMACIALDRRPHRLSNTPTSSRSRRGRTARGMQTQVGIIGGGPSGLLLAQLLQLAGISSVVLEIGRAHV